MSVLRPGGTNNIGARNVPAAVAWYIEKLGLREIKTDMDDCEGCVALGFDKEEYAVTVGPFDPAGASDEFTHSLCTGNIKKAHAFLTSRGVQVTEIQQDRQGTYYFEMRDLEGNVVEITEEP
jgi:catechol 2,3-dioxygenase-like lactoylglutathione lyase family enzyme